MSNGAAARIKGSIVRILNTDGLGVGCGLVVDERHVLTCAHVVADANAAVSETQGDTPLVSVDLVFPFSASKKSWSSKVSVWHPCREDPNRDFSEDIAVLTLDVPLPRDVAPSPLTLVSEWLGRPYVALGFPSAASTGDYVDGTFKDAQTNRWVAMLSHDLTDLQVDDGFSGGGILDTQLDGFAGIMVAVRSRGEGKPVAYMIPTAELLRAWPALPVRELRSAASGTPRVWPRPPEYVHRYTLLDARRGLVGREDVLANLREWQDDTGGATVLTLHAIGGSGKSAAAWTWFQQVFINNTNVRGGLWYSFYEPEASFGDFLRRLYRYVQEGDPGVGLGGEFSKQNVETLFQTLRREKLVVVLDGFERLLRAYNSERVGESPPPARAELTPKQERHLCIAPDENVNAFLTALAQPMASRFLITSRLVPSATLNAGGESRQFTDVFELDALKPEDVVEMMAGYGVHGSKEKILTFAQKFECHALLVKLVSAIIGNNMRHRRNFDSWLEANPSFDPTSLDVTENRVHVLQCSLDQLGPAEQAVLLHVAALRGAVAYSDLEALVVGPQNDLGTDALEAALRTLHQLTLIEWDYGTERNQFDLHPLVRNTVWLRAANSERTAVDQRLVAEFERFPSPAREDSAPNDNQRLSVFSAYIRLGRYDEAWDFAENHFWRNEHTFADVSLLLELTQSFLSPEEWPQLSSRQNRSECLLNLAKALELTCDSDRALRFYERHRPLCGSPTCMLHQASLMTTTGRLTTSDRIFEQVWRHVREVDDTAHEIATLYMLAASHQLSDTELPFFKRRMSLLFRRLSKTDRRENRRWLLWSMQMLVEREFEYGNLKARRKILALAKLEVAMWERLGDVLHLPGAVRDLARAEKKNGDLEPARANALRAIDLSRRAGQATGVAEGQIVLASIDLKLGNNENAKRLLQTAEETMNRRGDLGRTHNLKARLALADGDRVAARDYALAAYRIGWAEGPPMSYRSLMDGAVSLLKDLGCDPPDDMPPPAHHSAPAWRALVFEMLEHGTMPARVGEDQAAWEQVSAAEAERLLFVPREDLGSTEVDYTLDRVRSAIAEGDLSSAVDWGERAVQLDPEGPDCWASLGQVWYHAGDFEAAERSYSAAISKSRTDSHFARRYRAERALVLATMKRPIEALEEFSAANLESYFFDERFEAAHAYAKTLVAKSDEPMGALTDNSELTQYSFWTYFFQGRTLVVSGQWSAAADAFRKVIENQSPDVPRWLLSEIRQVLRAH